MIGILFATRREADPFLLETAATPAAGAPFAIFRATAATAMPLAVCISGMGKVAAAAATSHLVLALNSVVVISAGICGQLTASASVGDCFRIAAAMEGDSDRFGRPEPAVACDDTWFADRPAKRLVTCDRPVFDPGRRAALAEHGDLVDMEGAAVARVARLYDIPCAMLKGVSDDAGATGRQDIAHSIDRVSARIARHLIDELKAKPRIDSHET